MKYKVYINSMYYNADINGEYDGIEYNTKEEAVQVMKQAQKEHPEITTISVIEC